MVTVIRKGATSARCTSYQVFCRPAVVLLISCYQACVPCCCAALLLLYEQKRDCTPSLLRKLTAPCLLLHLALLAVESQCKLSVLSAAVRQQLGSSVSATEELLFAHQHPNSDLYCVKGDNTRMSDSWMSGTCVCYVLK